jgi:hypothetical protein
VSETWDRSAPGILRLPSGRLVRGRALSRPLPDGPVPAFGVYLLGRRPPAVPWESRWLNWPDFRLPADEADVLPALTEARQRAVAERVEIACAGGHGRTGTALACLAILDGVPGTEAVAFVREHYDPHAVETPGQRRYVAQWSAPCPTEPHPPGQLRLPPVGRGVRTWVQGHRPLFRPTGRGARSTARRTSAR